MYPSLLFFVISVDNPVVDTKISIPVVDIEKVVDNGKDNLFVDSFQVVDQKEKSLIQLIIW